MPVRRSLRALTFALVLSVAAAAAHRLAGGMLPAPHVLVAGAAACAVVGWWLAARPRSAAALAGCAAVGQVGLHLTYAATMPGPRTMASMVCGHPSGAAHPGLVVLRGPAMPGPGIGMVAAHVAGSVVTLVGLHAVEGAAGRVGAALGAVLRRLVPAAVPVAAAVRRTSLPRPPRLRSALLVHAAPRRGPPVCVRP